MDRKLSVPAPEPSPPDQHDPWWVGRALGVALALTLCFTVWAGTHEVAVGTAAPTSQWSAPTPDHLTTVSVVPVSLPARRPRPAAAPAVAGRSSARPDVREAEATRQATRQAPRQAAAKSRSAARVQRFQAQAAPQRARVLLRREIKADRELAAFIASVAVPEATQPWAAPLSAAYRITATFGESGSLWSRNHTGLDMAAPSGTPVTAAAAGTVTYASTDGAYGLRVAIAHADGSETWYAHLSRIDVAVGEAVEVGLSIGAVGATGNVTGPHLHLELRPDGGEPVDPVAGFAARGVVL